MFVDDVKTSSKHQLTSMLHTLKHVHGMDLKLDETSIEDIELLRESSEIIKNSIVSENAFNSWHSNPSYAKHMLIIEAARLYLKEIAPKRRPRSLREGTETRLDENKSTSVGRWMMDFSGKHKAKDDKTLAMLNSFSRVGEDLTSIGEPFGPRTINELIHSYKARAADEAGEEFDRRQARENLHALKLGFSMYDKHNPVDEAAVGEGDAFQAARLKAIKDGGRDGDRFMVGDKHFTLSNVGKEDIARAQEIDEMGSLLGKALTEDHMQSHDYQASMARAELYRNAKYGMDMLRMIRPEEDVEPWISACLTKSAMGLDKIYHYLDYYLKFEPNELGMRPAQARPEMPIDEDADDSTGTTARQNLMMIVEYSIKLFHMVQPGDKLEGWVAMMLTKASEGISSAKHWMDYKQFERHAGEHIALAESAGIRESGPTRKDFQMVADLIKAHPDAEARHHMAAHHAEIFAKRNPRFNRGKFFMAANASQTAPKKHHPHHKKSEKVSESTLMEDTDDLAQAETLIAAKSLSDELQTMAEKVAKMGVEDLMPLVDTMKSQFGPEAADGYNDIMKASLDSLLAATQEAKEKSDDAVMALQGGNVPATPSDIAAVGAAAGDEAGEATVGDELPPPEGDGMSTTPAAAGGEAPLGRRKKPVPGEEVTEAWGTEMHTAEKDKGKWDGWTLEKLKAKKAALMKKPTRTAAEQKTVKQIDFAIRAKQKDKWGKVDEAAKKAKPDFLDVDKDGNKKEPMKKALKDKKEVKEGAISGIAKLLMALGIAGAGYVGLNSLSSAKDTPLGKALAAAAAKGDKYAAQELSQLDAYVDAGAWQQLDNLKDTYLDVNTTTMTSPRQMTAPGKTSLPQGSLKEETTHTKDDRAEKAGKKVTKDIEYDERKKDGIHGAKRGKEDAKAEKAGKKVAKDIEHDEKVSEAKKPKNAYAIGMKQAKDEAGLGSAPVHDLPKKVIKRAHEIARGIEKTDEQLLKLDKMLESAEVSKIKLDETLALHRKSWKRMVREGKEKDVLGVGQGFEGDMIQRRISEVTDMINNLKGKIRAIEEAGEQKMAQVIDQEHRAYRFEQAKAKSPWGVMFESKGKRDYKFFEDRRARDYWVQLNADMDVKLIDPGHFDLVANA